MCHRNSLAEGKIQRVFVSKFTIGKHESNTRNVAMILIHMRF